MGDLERHVGVLGWMATDDIQRMSEIAHGGARTIGLEMRALVSEQPMLQYVVSNALLKALIYHFGARTFVAKYSLVWLWI